MDRFNALGRGMQIMLVAGVLLLIDTFLPWQDYDVGDVGQFSAWHGFGGVLLGLLTIVLVAWIAVRLAAIEIPLPVSATLIAAALGALILVIAVLKNLIDDESTIWSYIGVLLAVAIAVGAWLQVQATGGMESLKSELPSMPASSAPASTPPSSEPPAAAAPPPPAPAPPPPVSEPSPPESAPSSEERPSERDT